jgi:hypothetical protein
VPPSHPRGRPQQRGSRPTPVGARRSRAPAALRAADACRPAAGCSGVRCERPPRGLRRGG